MLFPKHCIICRQHNLVLVNDSYINYQVKCNDCGRIYTISKTKKEMELYKNNLKGDKIEY